MLSVDLHTHSLFSGCGLHTVIEILERAKRLGMTAVAVTDHGPALGARVASPFYDRLHHPVEGIRLLKGMECNLKGDHGDIDLPSYRLPYLDVVLLGMHHNTETGLGKDANTELMIRAVTQNKAVDILTHLNDAQFPMHFQPICEAATEHGVAIELNNSKTRLQRVDDSVTRELVRAALNSGARMAVTSDTHAIEELGCDDSVLPFLREVDFPEERIVTSTAERALAFLEERRPNKQQ